MSNLNYISLTNRTNLIDGVILHPLNVNRDSRGTLVESLRNDWEDVFNLKERGFAMQYYSITKPNTARDNRWHHHKFQEDRFVCAQGSIVTALYDPRPDSKTSGILNLIPMGQDQIDQNQFMLLIPQNVYHIYNVVGNAYFFADAGGAHLLSEFSVAATMPSDIEPVWQYTHVPVVLLVLPSGSSLKASTEKGEAFEVTAFGWKF
jgi:dTDP-4-dehydrorhamnose 3,5-epimerase-like enzyme